MVAWERRTGELGLGGSGTANWGTFTGLLLCTQLTSFVSFKQTQTWKGLDICGCLGTGLWGTVTVAAWERGTGDLELG